ncbi:MAG: TM0106 family RecB-like putative nuclease [Gemmatimonadaceae bacterium]|nr:TM0106 family RecB-like putative nuclease [Chitinophagaceae bacterium]
MSLGEAGENNVYAEWMREKNQSYRTNAIKRLSGGLQTGEFIVAPPANLNLKMALWRLVSEITVSSKELESCIHAVERTPSTGRGKPAQFVPIRFVTNNKLTKFDKLLVAFDAHILAETLKHEIAYGKIIHCDGFSVSKVKISVLVGEVRKIVGKITFMISADTPPDLILNSHCPKCEYQRRCREKAIEKDDLSLLGGMTEKERKKRNSKGIFTVTQLSYTFRPRRLPKRLRDKQEKYHHSLKALAIRENKIHIVGSPELYIEGTPVCLDVEGLPDRDFYYLIGVRIRHGDSVVQHSLWADRPEDEEKIWGEFVDLLSTIEKPVLIHYGSYETTFIKTMCSRYGAPCNSKLHSIQTSEVFETSEVSPEINDTLIAKANKRSNAEKPLSSAINLLSVIYGHVYFPVASNGLKEIAGYCGFQWSETLASGLQSIVWREMWEASKDVSEQDKLIRYNA